MDKNRLTPLSIFAKFMALCCISHFVTHLGPAQFNAITWWLAISVIVTSLVVLHHATVRRLLFLAGLQVAHAAADAPFNPDHWLLLFFVNAVLLCSAFGLWLRAGQVQGAELFSQFAPAARVVFLICYGFAALSKYNTHFLSAVDSCGTELAEIQLQVSPWLKYIVWPSLAGCMTVVCESAVVLLLLAPRTRRFGILVGLIFHTALVASPAIAVFDFSVTVYSMLFLFTPANFADRLQIKLDELQATAPALTQTLGRSRLPFLVACGLFILGRSSLGFAMYGDPTVGQLSWFINMGIAATIIFFAGSTLFASKLPSEHTLSTRPTLALHYVVIAAALLNGICPYIGLKTQGSFTMFSNLRTEGETWNHLLVPRHVRLWDHFQDDLWQVAKIDDPRIQRDFVERSYLVPRFEIQRAAAKNPSLAVTIIRDQSEIRLDPARLDPQLAERPSWLALKLMVFRPVTADGSAYCGN